jgi:putative transposase
MPNHFHGIVFLGIDPRGGSPILDVEHECATDLSEVVNGLKGAITRTMNKAESTPGHAHLQADYYDHIVRNPEDLSRIRQYIRDNPSSWELDRENALRKGLHPIYGLLDELPRYRQVAVAEGRRPAAPTGK